MNLHLRRWLLSALLACSLPTLASPALAQAPRIVSEANTRASLHLTAYRAGQETAFLKEVREVEVPAGDVRIALQGVPNTVQRESVAIRVLEGPPVEVIEQTFSYDVMTPSALLRAAEGSTITIDVSSVHDGKLAPIRAQVVATGQGGTVLRTRQGYTFGLDGERRRFSSIPKQLTPKPTLSWHARSAVAGKRKIEISYLLTGLGWSADYVATLSGSGQKVNLSGWVTLTNRTATQFKDSKLAVAAGTIHRVSDWPYDKMLPEASSKPLTAIAQKEPVRETLGHLHLYKIPHITTLEPHSIKNVQLLSLKQVPVQRRWIASFSVDPSRRESIRSTRPRLNLEMLNDKHAGAGIPIPAGTVRVMAPDRKGTAHMVSSTQVVDTPKGEKLKLSLGPVADVEVRMIPTDYRSSARGSNEVEYELRVRNGSSHSGDLRMDLLAGSYTTVQVQGIKVEKPSSSLYRFDIPLGPGAEQTIKVVAKHARPRR